MKHSCACPGGRLKGSQLFNQLFMNGLYKLRGGSKGRVSRYATPVSLCDTKGQGWKGAVRSDLSADPQPADRQKTRPGGTAATRARGRRRTRPEGGPRNPAAPPRRAREGLRRVLDPVLPAAASPYRKEEVRGVGRGRRGHRDGAPPRLPARSRAGAGPSIPRLPLKGRSAAATHRGPHPREGAAAGGAGLKVGLVLPSLPGCRGGEFVLQAGTGRPVIRETSLLFEIA